MPPLCSGESQTLSIVANTSSYSAISSLSCRSMVLPMAGEHFHDGRHTPLKATTQTHEWNGTFNQIISDLLLKDSSVHIT